MTNIGFGNMVVATDPLEFVKVMQHEGRHPDGLVPFFAGIARKYMPGLVETFPAPELYGRDDQWMNIRRFLQTGLLAPKSARGHLCNISKAAQLASLGACGSADDFGFFLNRCAFDAFASVLFGQFTQTANLETPTDPRHLEFLKNTIYLARVSVDPFSWEAFAAYFFSKLGHETAWWRDIKNRYNQTLAHTELLLNTFIEKLERDELDQYQQHSYFMSSLGRQQAADNMSLQKLKEITWTLLVTSVDTTSSLLYPATINLALNPAIQSRLAEELLEHVGKKDGIRADMLLGKTPGLQYLNAFLRECHRTRPGIGPIAHFKRPLHDIEMHGYTIPRDTMVVFDSHSIQNDPSVVGPDVSEFRPERWLPEEVADRKGTMAEAIDHSLLSKPFSHGARICPAARVAHIEVQCMVAQMVMDWHLALADKTIKSIEELSSVPFLPGLAEPFPKFIITPRSL